MMDKLRLRFSKNERAVYSSHLDLMRTMQRAFLRADLPLRYSEGFNPHALISILLPLPLGMSSDCELLDFHVTRDVDLGALPVSLSAELPEGIEVSSAYEPTSKVKDLKWLKIGGVLEYDCFSADISKKLAEFFARENIVITKKTKRGEGETDIKPAIRELSFINSKGGIIVDATISAQEPTLKPDLLVSALTQLEPSLAPDFQRFWRIENYFADMAVFA